MNGAETQDAMIETRRLTRRYNSGQREIVVKGFEPPVGTAPIFGGATILGDGRAVFVLDAARLV